MTFAGMHVVSCSIDSPARFIPADVLPPRVAAFPTIQHQPSHKRISGCWRPDKCPARVCWQKNDDATSNAGMGSNRDMVRAPAPGRLIEINS